MTEDFRVPEALTDIVQNASTSLVAARVHDVAVLQKGAEHPQGAQNRHHGGRLGGLGNRLCHLAPYARQQIRRNVGRAQRAGHSGAGHSGGAVVG
jgi:hypothetical protein